MEANELIVTVENATRVPVCDFVWKGFQVTLMDNQRKDLPFTLARELVAQFPFLRMIGSEGETIEAAREEARRIELERVEMAAKIARMKPDSLVLAAGKGTNKGSLHTKKAPFRYECATCGKKWLGKYERHYKLHLYKHEIGVEEGTLLTDAMMDSLAYENDKRLATSKLRNGGTEVPEEGSPAEEEIGSEAPGESSPEEEARPQDAKIAVAEAAREKIRGILERSKETS